MHSMQACFCLVAFGVLSGCAGAGSGPGLGETEGDTIESAIHSGEASTALMTQINKCKEGPCAVHIINEATGRCVALGADNQLVTEVCSSSSNQTFVIGNTGRAFWSFDLREIKHQVSGRCLTYSPGAPQATVCSSSSPGQSWSFMTGGHDEWIEPEATQGHTLQPHRADFLLRDDARSHRVLTHVRGTTINHYARWTFASAGQSAATEGLQK